MLLVSIADRSALVLKQGSQASNSQLENPNNSLDGVTYPIHLGGMWLFTFGAFKTAFYPLN